MRITTIAVTDFLALADAKVDMDAPLTVLTGANGTGKSTLLQAINLARDAVGAAAGWQAGRLDAEWSTAGHGGAESFEVRVGIRFDADDERHLLNVFYRAALLRLLHPSTTDVHLLAAAVDARLPLQPADALGVGEIVVRFDARQRSRWLVGWEFGLSSGRGHVQLTGDEVGRILDGPAKAGPYNVTYIDQLLPATNDIVEKVQGGAVSLRLEDVVRGRRVEFAAQATNADVEQRSIQAAFAGTGFQPSAGRDRLLFASVLDALLARRLHVTDNHRSFPRTQFNIAELAGLPDLRDGSMLALELHRLKNGDTDDRARFALIQETFATLTGDSIDSVEKVFASSDPSDPNGSGHAEVLLMPIVQVTTNAGQRLDVPLHRAGAGAAETLLLATLLADPRRSLFLDEPAVHVSPTGQRRLLAMLRARRGAPGQAVWVTHNPDLVPAREPSDLSSIVRLSRGPNGSIVNRLALDETGAIATTLRLLASSEMRSVLFAAGVVLCEGPTDLTALQRWLDDGVTIGGTPLPTPDERNVTFLSVDGHASFGPVVELADRLGVPWAVVADGPAMRPGSKMAKRLQSLGHTVPVSGSHLSDVRSAWAAAGVFTLATEFGDDGSKSGEIEVFLNRINARALRDVQRDVGAQKGAKVGAAFAAAVPVPPEVVQLWSDLLARLGHAGGPVRVSPA